MGGGWSTPRLQATYPPGKTRYHCTGGWVGRSGRVRKISPSTTPGFDPRTFQPVASRDITEWLEQLNDKVKTDTRFYVFCIYFCVSDMKMAWTGMSKHVAVHNTRLLHHIYINGLLGGKVRDRTRRCHTSQRSFPKYQEHPEEVL